LSATARDAAASTHSLHGLREAHPKCGALATATLIYAGLVGAQDAATNATPAPATSPPAATATSTAVPATPTPPTSAPSASAPSTAGPTPADSPHTVQPPPGIARVDAYAEFRRLYDAKQYEAAAKQGQHVVQLVEADKSAPPDELQVALMNLAAAQSFAEDYIGAEATYLRVIGLLEADGRIGSARMARATAGLAAVYNSSNRYNLAVPAYERAITMSRRSEGLFNTDQLPLLDGYVESTTELGQYQQALTAQMYALRIVERSSGVESPQVIDRLESVGRWFTRVGAYEPGRQYLRAAVRMVEKKQGEKSIDLVGPLTAIAESFRRQLLDPDAMRESADADRDSMFHDPGSGATPQSHVPGLLAAEGERALERAVEVVDAQPAPSPLQVADVRTQMGDWYQTRLQIDRALPHYRIAWDAAGKAPDVNGKSVRELLFGRPVLLHYVRSSEWDRYARKPASEIQARSVDIELTVSGDGRVRARRIVANDGDTHMGEEALDAADTARYRPRFVDGTPVETNDVHLVQTYYVPIEKTAPADASKPDGSTPGGESPAKGAQAGAPPNEAPASQSDSAAQPPPASQSGAAAAPAQAPPSDAAPPPNSAPQAAPGPQAAPASTTGKDQPG
jgi:tetratricopeptide (TPR) repeat protein